MTFFGGRTGPGRARTVTACGGRGHTRAMLGFYGNHGITADVETVPSREVNTSPERLARGDVRYRFALGLADLR